MINYFDLHVGFVISVKINTLRERERSGLCTVHLIPEELSTPFLHDMWISPCL
jgi:hypothetical protein